MRITIRDREANKSVTVLLGGPVKPTYGPNWSEVQRPKRKSFPDWQGEAAIRLSVPVLLEGWISRVNQKPAFDFLTGLGKGRGDKAATTVRVSGGPSIPHQDLVYVLEGIELGDDTLFDEGNEALLRQSVTLTLMEKDPKAGSIVLARKKAPVRTYTTKKGDTLFSIAKRRLGKSSRWIEIRALNKKLRDPRKKFDDKRGPYKLGARIRIPGA